MRTPRSALDGPQNMLLRAVPPTRGSSGHRSHDPVTALLGADDKESKTGVQTSTVHTFRAALPTMAPRWKQPKYPSKGE